MKCSINGMDRIRDFEKLRLVAYKCVATEKKWTIGYGHYGVKEHMTITREEAEDFFQLDIAKAERAVDKYKWRYKFNQNQFDALVSFAFNIGSINQLTHIGKRTISEISDAILLYNKSGVNTLKGLTSRRKVEQMVYNMPYKGDRKSDSQLAKEVIEGKWGTGIVRRVRLETAGYNYEDVQKYVNLLLL